MTNSQRRIDLDRLSRNVSANKNFEDYSTALCQIQRNSASRSLSRRLAEEKKEKEIEQHLLQAEEESRLKEEKLIHDQKLACEESKRIRQEYHERKLRQQIRENNQELRELESKLRTAYVSKTLAAQKKELEALALAEKLQQKEERKMLEKARLDHLEEQKKKQEIDRERKKKLHDDLTKQIMSAHQQHQKLYEEFLREKYYLDEIAARVKQELLEETQKKIALKEKTKQEMDAFKITKKELEKMQNIETEEENQRIIEYCQYRDKKIQEEERRAKELEENRKNLNDKMVAELSELNEKKAKREELLQELWAFEQNEKVEERMREQLEYRFRIRIEARLALEDQLMDKEKRKQLEEQEDKIYWQKQLEMLAERDRVDQLSHEKRRQKLIQHRKAIREMMEERKIQKALNLAEEIKQQDLEQQREQRRQEIVEEERVKIIQEHAKALMGFLPSGVLRESDRKYLPMNSKIE
ncbi:CLUMA_CG008463, isoform A [Clunio marinus]|uniref:Meiosis-specific nuclear structural protein 1 n=1 Tax=Clunio marinus TaxID=568069 RepID=A0A1J1I3Q8_9DIPT|nr:CLUMA_CG008463, isoform A [Clunio marinus]